MNKNTLDWKEFYDTFVYGNQEYCFKWNNKYLYFISDGKRVYYNIKQAIYNNENLCKSTLELLECVRLRENKIIDIWDELLIYDIEFIKHKNAKKILTKHTYKKVNYEEFLNDLILKEKYFILEYNKFEAHLYVMLINEVKNIVYMEIFSTHNELLENMSLDDKKLIELWSEFE